MLKPQTKALSIATTTDQTTLSKGQKTFNNLIKKIEVRRSKLAAWQEIAPLYQQRYNSELLPLVEIEKNLKVEFVYLLDSACEQKGLTAAERRKVADIITELAASLIANRDDDELKEIYNKHSGFDFDSQESETANEIMFEAMTGVDPGDDFNDSTLEEFIKRAQERMQEHEAGQEEILQAQAAQRATRKKTAKQLAKEAQQKAEELEVDLSIREVYRKLVSALHPDRETDPREHERKTVLMQRVNQAYDKKNLLLLLELQLELEHIDQTTISNLSETRLKHCTKILKEQLAELEQEILSTEDMFKARYGIEQFAQLYPDTVMRQIEADIADTTLTIDDIKRDLVNMQDIKMLKVLLKSFASRRKTDLWDSPF